MQREPKELGGGGARERFLAEYRREELAAGSAPPVRIERADLEPTDCAGWRVRPVRRLPASPGQVSAGG